MFRISMKLNSREGHPLGTYTIGADLPLADSV